MGIPERIWHEPGQSSTVTSKMLCLYWTTEQLIHSHCQTRSTCWATTNVPLRSHVVLPDSWQANSANFHRRWRLLWKHRYWSPTAKESSSACFALKKTLGNVWAWAFASWNLLHDGRCTAAAKGSHVILKHSKSVILGMFKRSKVIVRSNVNMKRK